MATLRKYNDVKKQYLNLETASHLAVWSKTSMSFHYKSVVRYGLYYPALPCIALHYPALPCITLHYRAIPCNTLHCLALLI